MRRTTLLDFGCGSGAFLRSAALRGYAARGVEYTDKAAEMAQSVSGVRVGRLESLLDEGAKFDVVRLGHVITAISDPAALLRTLEQLVAPGGFFLIETAAENTPSVAYWTTAAVKGGPTAAAYRHARQSAHRRALACRQEGHTSDSSRNALGLPGRTH